MIKKGFGEILSDSWKEYRYNWKVYFLIILLLSIIPSLILFLVQIVFMRDVITYAANPDAIRVFSATLVIKYLILFLFSLIIGILGVWLHASIIYSSLSRKKLVKFKESLAGGRKYFWKYLGLSLLMLIIFFSIILIAFIFFALGVILIIYLGIQNPISIITVILLILLVIAVILLYAYLVVRWLFSAYILIGENKGIIHSIKLSSNLVRGRWWKTFGYIFLFFLIAFIILIALSLIYLIIRFIINPNYLLNPTSIDVNLYILNRFISMIFEFFGNLVFTPLSLLFIKNLYLTWKSSK
ncbi:Uncharacterised protein [uncultured archaeon]|nr:Uncharacterised protein [uncultured archaeon]